MIKFAIILESATAGKSFLPFGRSCFAVAREIVNYNYGLERLMGHLANYFDYNAYACYVLGRDCYRENGYVFPTRLKQCLSQRKGCPKAAPPFFY